MFKRSPLIFLLLILFNLSFAQEVKVAGRFDTDSIKLGKPIQFYLSAIYPKNNQVLFPDSTFLFAPFEFEKKIFFTTRTINNLSYDSAIYTLTTFEIDSLQILALPVFQVQQKDCLVYYTKADTVFFKKMVASVPDSLAISQLPLKTNTAYNSVRWLLNYPLASIIAGALIVAALVVWIVFGKRIKKYFILKKLTNSHGKFLSRFEQTIENVRNSFTPELAESAVTLWKKYMEELSARPYTKYTSREITDIETRELGQTLHAVDRMIYGRMAPETFDSFQHLKEFTQNRFNQKMEEVKHG